MKKILFATTALVATAGVAAADVTFGGFARWGVDYNEGRGAATSANPGPDGVMADDPATVGYDESADNVAATPATPSDKTRITSRFRLIVTATTESDGGLTFGTQSRLQLDAAESNYNGNGFNNPRFWVSTGGLEISMGHILGALEFMPGKYAGTVGLTGLGYGNVVVGGSDLYTSGATGRQGIDIRYSAGDFSAHLSHSMAQVGGYGINGTTERTAGFVAYSFGDYNAALGLQDSNQVGDNEWFLTASGTFGPANVTLQVADNGNQVLNSNTMKYGVAASFDVGAATSVSAYVNHDEKLKSFTGGNNFGIGVVHDLGGGASIRGGIVQMDAAAAGDSSNTAADLGVQFSF